MTISREVLGKYLKPGMSFIETGTRWGDGCVRAADLGAAEIYTCESDFLMKGLADAHMRDTILRAKYSVYCLDSPKFLREVSSRKASGNCVVALDAHDSNQSPLLEELEAIQEWQNEHGVAWKPKVILIDDMCSMEYWHIDFEDIHNRLQAIGDHDGIWEDGRRERDIYAAVYA